MPSGSTLLMNSPFLLGGYAVWNGIPTISQENLEVTFGWTVIYQSELGRQLALSPPGAARFIVPSALKHRGTSRLDSEA